MARRAWEGDYLVGPQGFTAHYNFKENIYTIVVRGKLDQWPADCFDVTREDAVGLHDEGFLWLYNYLHSIPEELFEAPKPPTCEFNRKFVVDHDGVILELKSRDLASVGYLHPRENADYHNRMDAQLVREDAAMRAKVARNIREWPVCKVTGEPVSLHTIREPDDNDDCQALVSAHFHCEACHGET